MRTTPMLARWTLLFGLLAAPAFTPMQAAVDMFLKIGDLKGETLDDAHFGESDVLSWSWGMNNPPVIGTTGGSAAGKVTVHALTMNKRVDTASPKLMQACSSGARYPRAILTLRKRGETSVEFARVVMEDVNVAGILIGLSQPGDPMTETLSLRFARVGVEYFTIMANGEPGQRVEFAWNIPANALGGVTFPGKTPADADADGLPDEWERRYELDLTGNDAALDRDRDGATNWEEYVAGTSPVDVNQVFKSTLQIGANSPGATLSWVSAASKTYRILVTDQLGTPFQPFSTVPSAGDGTTSISLPATSVNRFFRVEVVP